MRPVLEVGHRLERVHLLDRVAREHVVVRIGEEGRPAAQVGRRAPELSGGGGGATLDDRLFQRLVRPRVDEVTGGDRRCGLPGRPGQFERAEDALVHVTLVLRPGDPRDHLAEEREAQVRVVPVRAGRQHLLALLQAVDQLLARGERQRLPDPPRRLPLEAGGMAEQEAEGRRPGRAGDVPVQRVVERELALVAELHHRDGGEGLRDRRDPVLVIRGRVLAALDVGDAHRVGPDHLAVAHGGRRHARQALLRLRDPDLPLERGGQRLRRGQGRPVTVESARSRARRPRRRRRGA